MTPPVTSLKMTAAQFNKALDALGLNQTSAAEFLGLTLRTTHGYANGRDIPTAVAKLLRVMIQHNLKPEDVR